MRIVALFCQMGNQMFQYAFARARRGIALPWASSYEYGFKLGYFRLDPLTRYVYSHPWTERTYRRVCQKLIKWFMHNKVGDRDGYITIDPEATQGYHEGFFQGDVYFKNALPKIRKAFEIKPQYRKAFDGKYCQFFATHKVVAVHLRRTDYTEVEFEGLGGRDVSLPLDYYHKALALIPNLEQYEVLFVSDDIESVRRDFEGPANYHFESNSPIVDFQIIQHADVAIISNSTFAWWAAYLSKNPSPRTIAPKHWIGHKVGKTFPAGIETARFEWIEVPPKN